MSAPPAIVDTNVVVSGLLTAEHDAATRLLLDRMLAGDLYYYLSLELLAEYRDVLLRPDLQSLHGLADDEIDAILETLTVEAIVRTPSPTEHDAPDPDDRHLWRLAASIPDAAVVTGDGALLRESPSELSVVTPRDYLELLDET